MIRNKNFTHKIKPNYSTRTTWRFENFDTSNCSLEDLQNLVIQTTDLLSSRKSTTDSSIEPTNNTHKPVTTISILSSDNPILHSEPLQDNSHDATTPKLNRNSSIRQDSGFVDSK